MTFSSKLGSKAMKTTNIADYIEPKEFLAQAVQATTVKAIASVLAQLPIASEDHYTFTTADPEKKWTQGKLHWVPLGKDRGNAGRIKLAGRPEGPIAERTINAMESLIELERRREILKDPTSKAPVSPRQAVARYFNLPPLDQIPKLTKPIKGQNASKYARELAKAIRVRVAFDKGQRQFAVSIEDDGIGQAPERMHETLLSLGSSDKGDKPYLIGLFGQGGSSTYAASEYSWCISRRAPEILDGRSNGVGWTVVRQVFPEARRDPYYAYLAAHPSGTVPALPAEAAEAIGLKHGARFVHINYNFAGGGSAVMRSMYYMLNHILYNPVLPFDLYAGPTQATIYGNGYRLSNAYVNKKAILDKIFAPQPLTQPHSAAKLSAVNDQLPLTHGNS